MAEIRGVLRISRFKGGGPIASLSAFCPACDFEHGFRVDLDGHGHYNDNVWSFDGNWDKPTFSPSMGANIRRLEEHHPICHSFVRNGRWEYLNDSTHAMAGKTVAMVSPDPDMSFQRQHGWHLYPWTDDDGKPMENA